MPNVEDLTDYVFPLVAETYDAWGNEPIEAFSRLAPRIAIPLYTLTCKYKSAVLTGININNSYEI